MFVQNSKEYNDLKQQALDLFKVQKTADFNAQSAIKDRIDFLKNHLKKNNLNAYVLGISGGVDSTTVGKLCQMACDELRQEGYLAQFIAVRLPAGVQLDEEDANDAIDFIKPDKIYNINIGKAANNINFQVLEEFARLEDNPLSDQTNDFNKGNLKARLRMSVQYQLAAMYNGLVIGTDHNSEAITGFYTKWGDNACDLIVLNGLNKTQVRLLAQNLGAPQHLWNKPPTADLEELNPGRLDEDSFGFPYFKLDQFLEGESIDSVTEFKIINQFRKTQHKRVGIPQFTKPS